MRLLFSLRCGIILISIIHISNNKYTCLPCVWIIIFLTWKTIILIIQSILSICGSVIYIIAYNIIHSICYSDILFFELGTFICLHLLLIIRILCLIGLTSQSWASITSLVWRLLSFGYHLLWRGWRLRVLALRISNKIINCTSANSRRKWFTLLLFWIRRRHFLY